jgi:hypothetical protein
MNGPTEKRQWVLMIFRTKLVDSFLVYYGGYQNYNNLYDFSKATLCNFCKITVNHYDHTKHSHNN